MLAFVPFLMAVAATAFVASRFRPGAWYAALAKPSWTPPGAVFGPVWSVLYLAIAVAGWRVWRNGGLDARRPLVFWAAQLLLNAAWSWIFFGLRRPALALLDIALLLASIAAFAFFAREFSAAAAWLFVPYGAWVVFAMALNAAIARANPGIGKIPIS